MKIESLALRHRSEELGHGRAGLRGQNYRGSELVPAIPTALGGKRYVSADASRH
jgi:hypothetical protein